MIDVFGSVIFILYEHLLSVTRENKCVYDKAVVLEFIFGISLYLNLKNIRLWCEGESYLFGTLIVTNNNKMTLVNHTGEIEFDLKGIYYIELIGIK